MPQRRNLTCIAAFLVALAAWPVFADEQSIPAGGPEEGELAVDSGADGVCASTAAGDDVQLTPVGAAAPRRPEIECGADGIVGSTAGGDDTQLRAPGSYCGAADVPVIDTGADGIANTVLAGDDAYAAGVVFGAAVPNTPCVGTGPDGIASSTAIAFDTQVTAVGFGNASRPVVTCGDDLIPSTTANNANPLGDDTQEIPVSLTPTCGAASDVVVRSGPTSSIADTRAEGPELVLRAMKPVKVSIARGRASASKSFRLQVYNQEFGAAAPASRQFRIEADDGSCPDGTVTLVDADPKTEGLQLTGSVELGRSATASLLATFPGERVRTVSSRIPFRCNANITVLAVDTAPEEDDARVRRNNTTSIGFEVYDGNDLQ